ncbi:hypothetical protein BD779DRAFT_1478597, partial [Infundibulicybe gibba]
MTRTPGVPTEVVATPSPGTSTLVPVASHPTQSTDSRSSSRAANDVNHFFPRRLKTDQRICIVCGPQYDALINKSEWPKNKTFSFGPTTATGNMRRHLEKWHSKAVEKISLERGWPIVLAGYKE